MKTYTKTHTDKKVFNANLKKIKARGGKAETSGLTIKYSFPKEK